MAEAATAPTTALAAEKIPLHFELGSNIIDSAIVRPMTFQTYGDYITEALAMTQPSDIDARLRRIRLSKQVSYHVNGTTIPVSTDEVLRLTGLAPIKMVSEQMGRNVKVSRLPPTVEASARANTGIQNVGDGTATCRMPHATLDEPVFGAA